MSTYKITHLGIDYAGYFTGYHSDADILAIGAGDSSHAAADDAMEIMWQSHLFKSVDDWMEIDSALCDEIESFDREVIEFDDDDDEDGAQHYVAIEIFRS